MRLPAAVCYGRRIGAVRPPQGPEWWCRAARAVGRWRPGAIGQHAPRPPKHHIKAASVRTRPVGKPHRPGKDQARLAMPGPTPTPTRASARGPARRRAGHRRAMSRGRFPASWAAKANEMWPTPVMAGLPCPRRVPLARGGRQRSCRTTTTRHRPMPYSPQSSLQAVRTAVQLLHGRGVINRPVPSGRPVSPRPNSQTSIAWDPWYERGAFEPLARPAHGLGGASPPTATQPGVLRRPHSVGAFLSSSRLAVGSRGRTGRARPIRPGRCPAMVFPACAPDRRSVDRCPIGS